MPTTSLAFPSHTPLNFNTDIKRSVNQFIASTSKFIDNNAKHAELSQSWSYTR